MALDFTRSIKLHMEIEQGTDEWLDLRLGVLTASEVCNLFTKKFAPSYAETASTLAYKKAAERINKRIGEHFMSSKMERGHTEEALAVAKYSEKVAPITECGFITNDSFGYVRGCSPDGLVGQNGGVEVKSRDEHFQVRTVDRDEVPDEYMLQIQDTLLVSGRDWWDFISYSNGMPMFVKRVLPDLDMHEKIKERCHIFELQVQEIVSKFNKTLAQGENMFPCEWVDHEDYIGEILP